MVHNFKYFIFLINFKKVIGSVTGDQILAETLAKNNYGYGDRRTLKRVKRGKKIQRKRGKNTRKKYNKKKGKK